MSGPQSKIQQLFYIQCLSIPPSMRTVRRVASVTPLPVLCGSQLVHLRDSLLKFFVLALFVCVSLVLIQASHLLVPALILIDLYGAF